MENYSQKITSATKWSAITSILRKFVTPVSNMILARLLTPEAFGVVATINMIISFADVFTDAGFQKYLIQHEFKNRESLIASANVAFWTNLLLSIFVWMLIAVFSVPISEMVGSKGYETQLIVAAFAIPMTSFSSIQQALFKRNFDFKGMFVPQMISSVVPLVVTIPIALVTRDSWALICGTLASKLSDAIFLSFKSWWKPKLYYNILVFREMFSFSSWTLLESISIWITSNVDIFIIGRTASSYNLGLYKTAITTVSQITNLIITIVVSVLFSALSRYQNDFDRFSSTLYSFQKKTAFFLVPMSVGLYVYRDVVTWILLGKQWEADALFIGLNGLVQAVTVIYAYFGSEVYRSKGEPKISLLVQVIYIVSIVPVITYTAGRSFDEMCLSKIILMLWFVIIHLIVMKWRYNLNIRHMFGVVIYPGIAAIIMGGVGSWFNKIFLSYSMRLFSIFICGIVYFLLTFLFSDTRTEVLFYYNTLKDKLKIKH